MINWKVNTYEIYDGISKIASGYYDYKSTNYHFFIRSSG